MSYLSHYSKEELLELLLICNEKIKKFQKSEASSRGKLAAKQEGRRNAIFEIFLNLIRLFKSADKMVSIENSQTNLRCLLTSAKILNEWFEQMFTKIGATQIDKNFEAYFISKKMTQNDVNLKMSSQMINESQRKRFEHHIEVKKSCQEQKAFRESFLKSHTEFDIDLDDAENEEDTKLLSIEEAVLIIQKLERKYQAISRRNYVRFVRERAAELHGIKTEIDATQAAIRIQARTRGYFARKMVREMRSKELEVLQMKPESIIKLKCERKTIDIVSKNQQIDGFANDLETAINELKTNFYLTLDDSPSETKIENKIQGDTVFLDACFRGIVSPLPNIAFDRLISQKETVKIEGKILNFDLRSFFTLVFCIPMALNTITPKQGSRRWILLIGAQDSGKTAWVKAISKSCSITHVHISKNVVTQGKRNIYSVVKKLAKQERRLIVSIDRIDLLRVNQKSKGYNHRQMLLRTFLLDLSLTSATVFGMARTEELDSATREMFPIQVNISNPVGSTRYDLIVDCLSRNMEQDRLPKVPNRIFDIEKQTRGFSNGKASKFVTNRWSAANKTNISIV
ncbi:unnamed protein product [Caenorhabditis angaria]|uniref:ATPase AAA-type core domain-containing protein n=1 Tax=Caenorhabditis angaria TaxID=860376 RepID=A0A9P1MVH0_9PELO|nr:unnamed protein product [Caenorhabditis angaria]